MKESLAMTVFDLIRISIQGGTRYYVLTDVVKDVAIPCFFIIEDAVKEAVRRPVYDSLGNSVYLKLRGNE
jgi:hypothetical protein